MNPDETKALVERLRAAYAREVARVHARLTEGAHLDPLLREAADAVERLTAERDALAAEVMHARKIIRGLMTKGHGTGKSLTAWCEDAGAWLAHVEDDVAP